MELLYTMEIYLLPPSPTAAQYTRSRFVGGNLFFANGPVKLHRYLLLPHPPSWWPKEFEIDKSRIARFSIQMTSIQENKFGDDTDQYTGDTTEDIIGVDELYRRLKIDDPFNPSGLSTLDEVTPLYEQRRSRRFHLWR